MTGAAPAVEHRVFWRSALDNRWHTHPVLTFDYLRAVAVQTVLEDARLKDRLPLVTAVVVRSTADPDVRWKDALTDGLGLLFVGRLPGTTDSRTPAKRVGMARGEYAREGGWVYRNGRPLVHGWDAYSAANRLVERGLTLMARDPRDPSAAPRYYVNDLLTIDPAEVFSRA